MMNVFKIFRYDVLYVSDGINGWDSYTGVYPFGDGSIDYVFSPMRTPNNTLVLQFLSDDIENRKGWLVEYRIGKN